MENKEIIIGEDVIEHSGVKGMRWGIRRYQNPDGTLTSAGRARYGKSSAGGSKTSSKIAKKRVKNEGGKKKVKALEEKRKEQATTVKKTVEPPKKKSVKDMSDAELQSAINRMQLEQRYSQLNPQQVSKGKKFVQSTMNKVVIPAVQEGTKQILRDAIVDAGKSYVNKNKKK